MALALGVLILIALIVVIVNVSGSKARQRQLIAAVSGKPDPYPRGVGGLFIIKRK
jgi:hypothetical protein